MDGRVTMGELLDDITECPVCRESYTDPRSLPCVHSFCLKCITKLSENKLPEDSVACPLCRKTFKIPKDGIKGLPNNFFVAKILEMKDASGDQSARLCDPCSAKCATRKTSKAVAFCVDCQENLCETCSDVHSRMKSTRAHRTEAVNEEFNTPKTGLPTVCDKHPNKALELYCRDCREALCVVCFITQHNGHRSDEIEKVVSSFRQALGKGISELQRTSLQIIMKALESGQDRRRKCFETFSAAEREVCARAEELKAAIERHKQQLLTELEPMKRTKLKDIDNTITEITQDKTILESFIKYSDKLLTKGSDGDIAKEWKNLKLRLTEIEQLCNKNGERLLPEAVVTFTPSESLSDRISSPNFVGSLSGELCPTLKISQTGNSYVIAVCLSDGQLFSTRHGIKEINVFDASTLTLKRKIAASVSNGSLFGLAVCKINICLYVADTFSDTVYRVNLTATDLKFATKWQVASRPYGLSVNSSNNLLVACCDAKKIQEYTASGSLIREISDNSHLWHTVELSRGTIILSQTGPVHGVSKKTIDGGVVKLYGSTSRGSGPGQMNEPRSLAVDSKGFILVACCNDNRILVLNPELTEARRLPVPHDVELKGPLALCYDEPLGHLYVGEWAESYRLLVFSQVSNLSSLFSQ